MTGQVGKVSVRVCPSDHRHDVSSTCYTFHKCRCLRCRAGNAARGAVRRRLLAYGRWDRARGDVAPVLAHLQLLQSRGYSYVAIETVCGVSSRTVWRIMTGGNSYVFATTARRILAITPTVDDLEPTARITAEGVARRVQALGTLGWSTAAVAKQLGVPRYRLSQWAWSAEVTVRTHRLVADVYERLWNAAPPAATAIERVAITKTLRRATELGWAPPLAWDDIDLDAEPMTAPAVDSDASDIDVVAIELATSATPDAPAGLILTREERHIAVRELNSHGYNDQEISRMLLVADKTIARDRDELGIPAVEDSWMDRAARKAIAA